MTEGITPQSDGLICQETDGMPVRHDCVICSTS